jgi:hypothetical protein
MQGGQAEAQLTKGSPRSHEMLCTQAGMRFQEARDKNGKQLRYIVCDLLATKWTLGAGMAANLGCGSSL